MSQNRFENDELYRLLPTVVRSRDGLTVDEPLRNVLKNFGQQADRVEERIRKSYANFFVETCAARELAYIADLIGYRPIIAPQPEDNGQSVNAADTDCPSKLVLRRDVAKTIWARRRKGTPEVLGAIVRSITGWHAVVFENNREVVATPSIRFAGAPRSQGTPDFRKLVGRNRIDQGPGLIPRVATARRVDASGARGRWHPLDVVVEARSQRAKLHEPADLLAMTNCPYLVVRGHEDDQRLYLPADESADATQILESARPMHLSDFLGKDLAAFRKQIYGMEKAISLYQSDPNGEPVEVCLDEVMFGSVPDPAVTDVWIIDPEQGRIQPPANNRDPVFLRCYLACNSDVSKEVEETLRVRLNEHVPMEARTGVVHRSEARLSPCE